LRIGAPGQAVVVAKLLDVGPVEGVELVPAYLALCNANCTISNGVELVPVRIAVAAWLGVGMPVGKLAGEF